ncbi:hypothetical protein JAAARDRAFT_535179 [Jaapia argillacea MUCL 33604]|uniref:Uncharacterized protein n=1 Tax=Jaapia argillacea MUCL 33604 TaxID=933084 RepID=A0A067PJL1_9AGAM|nr:hypothetical protein JAAARDRAFT_535179 [Jaapia argillacea MUCL 33604]
MSRSQRRAFKVDTRWSEHDTDTPTPATYALLPSLISRLPRLDTLTFHVQDPFVSSFHSSFSSHDPLSTVSKLEISLNCSFLISRCPNIREFEGEEVDDDDDGDEAVGDRVESWAVPLGRCNSLRVLRTHTPIGSGMLRSLIKNLPQIEELHFAVGIVSWAAEPEDKTNNDGIMASRLPSPSPKNSEKSSIEVPPLHSHLPFPSRPRPSVPQYPWTRLPPAQVWCRIYYKPWIKEAS